MNNKNAKKIILMTLILLMATSTLLCGCGKVSSSEPVSNAVSTDISAKAAVKTKSISLDDFLDKTTSDGWDFVSLNQNGDVTYKGMTVLTSRGLPLNNENAYTTIEIKVLLSASGAKPRKDCDPSDPANGSLGCYTDNPDDFDENTVLKQRGRK